MTEPLLYLLLNEYITTKSICLKRDSDRVSHPPKCLSLFPSAYTITFVSLLLNSLLVLISRDVPSLMLSFLKQKRAILETDSPVLASGLCHWCLRATWPTYQTSASFFLKPVFVLPYLGVPAALLICNPHVAFVMHCCFLCWLVLSLVYSPFLDFKPRINCVHMTYSYYLAQWLDVLLHKSL